MWEIVKRQIPNFWVWSIAPNFHVSDKSPHDANATGPGTSLSSKAIQIQGSAGQTTIVSTI